MATKQIQNASDRKRSKTLDDKWSYLSPDILFSIIMRLGVVDFVAFSCVCKTWRTSALSNMSTFMRSRQPMAICVSTEVATNKECWLEDCDGRRFSTILPRSSGRIYVGLASGYLVLFGNETRDFMLVNPITRHELHFPCCPFHVVTDPKAFRGTLVFSPTESSWVFVISALYSTTVSFSLSSIKQASWMHLSSDIPILDLQYFQGKIYTLNRGLRLYEVRLYPNPALRLLKMKNPVSHFIRPEFATLGERLFVTDYLVKGRYGSVEVDLDQMKWGSPVALTEKLCSLSILRCGIYKLEFWEAPHTHYSWFGFYCGTDKDKLRRAHATTNMWYFPHKCLDNNRLHE